MEKRIFIAVLLSLAFLWTWAALAPRFFPELAKRPTPAATATSTPAPAAPTAVASKPAASTPAPAAAAPSMTAAPAVAPVAATKAETVVIDMPHYIARFSNRGAQLVSFQLKSYETKVKSKQPVELVKARPANSTDFPFRILTGNAALSEQLNSALYTVDQKEGKDGRTLEFRYAGNGVAVTKRFTFRDEYLFDFATSVNPPRPYRVEIGPGIRTIAPDEKDTQFMSTGNGVYQADGKLKVIGREKKGDPVQVFPDVEYAGIEDNYFLSVLRPDRPHGAVFKRIEIPGATPKDKRREFYAGINAEPNGALAGHAFFGPKQTNILEKYGLDKTLQFGMFGFIGRVLLEALLWVNQFTKNYGFAIIVLTILIKIVLYPLQHKSIVSMKKMQKLQPKMETIKNRYKKAKTDPDQRTKMNAEMMQLYQKEGINPMSGCLPILLQMPILFGFYGLLSRAIELRGAGFILWIQDLSEKDPYYITPILMTITMFIQTWITPATGDPAQRRIFLMMPLIFGFFFKDFPSGLVLYWLVQNILTIIQQTIMNKYWKDHPAELQTA